MTQHRRLVAGPFVARLAQDVKYVWRSLRRHPVFACGAIAILVLGVGATTAVFSVLRGVLIAPLPYRDPEQLVVLRSQVGDGVSAPMLTSLEFAALQAQTDVFAAVAAIVQSDGNLTAAEQMAPLTAAAVSDTALETLGVVPAIGRGPQRGDAGRAITISHAMWQRYFGGDPSIVGRTIEVNNRPLTVVGVLPGDFTLYLGSDVGVAPRLDVLFHRSTGYDEDPFRGNVIVARVRQGVAIATVQAAVTTVAQRLVAEHPESYRTGPLRLSVAPMQAAVVSDARPALIAAAGAVALVLVVACANLANLLLVRAATRAREIAVRLAIGASRRDIVRQLIVEGVVLGAIGAAGGWTLAHWGVAGLLALAPAALPRREAIAVDAGVALFAVAVALVCAVIVSLVPAQYGSSGDIQRHLGREAVRTGRTRGLLLAAQLALSVMLLVGASLLAQAFVSLRAVPLGFEPADAVTMAVALDGQRFRGSSPAETRGLRQAFYDQLVERVRGVPGVRAAGVGFPLPLSGVAMSQRVSLGPAARERDVDGFIALAGYVEALAVPLIAGRSLTPADNDRAVVLVDEHLARELWPGQSAVGQRLLMVSAVDAPLWTEVVGVVAHMRARSPRAPGPPQVWMTYAVRAYAQLDLVVRGADPLAAVPPAMTAVQQLAAGRPVRSVRRLDDQVAEASADTRFALLVIGVLAVIAVLLAAVGVYAVVAYGMARRTREMAVRRALGASRSRLIGLVLGEGARWAVAGLAAGLAGAAVVSRALTSLLFGVGPHDGATFAAVAALLVVVALSAAALPALEASRVDPALALRD